MMCLLFFVISITKKGSHSPMTIIGRYNQRHGKTIRSMVPDDDLTKYFKRYSNSIPATLSPAAPPVPPVHAFIRKSAVPPTPPTKTFRRSRFHLCGKPRPRTLLFRFNKPPVEEAEDDDNVNDDDNAVNENEDEDEPQEEPPVLQEEPPVLRRSSRIAAAAMRAIGPRRSPRLATMKRVCYRY